MSHAAIVDEWFERVWNRGDESAIDELMADDMITHGLAPEATVGREPFLAFYRTVREAFESIHITVDESIESGDRIAYRATAHINAGSPPRSFTITGAGFNRMRNGQLAEGWNHWDFLGLLVELGAVAPDAFQKALQRQPSGEEMTLRTLESGL